MVLLWSFVNFQYTLVEKQKLHFSFWTLNTDVTCRSFFGERGASTINYLNTFYSGNVFVYIEVRFSVLKIKI